LRTYFSTFSNLKKLSVCESTNLSKFENENL
jgi:hypothetical protein